MAGPWQALFCVEHFDNRRRRAASDHDVGGSLPAVTLRHQKPRQLLRFGDRRRQPDRAYLGREPRQPCQTQRQQIAALRRHQRVQLVEYNSSQG